MGIWLDKGELEKSIEKARYIDSESSSYYGQERHHRHHDDHDYDGNDDRDKYENEKNVNSRRKRGGIAELFGNLFD
jgi:Zn-finger nucleic acid-binding protein